MTALAAEVTVGLANEFFRSLLGDRVVASNYPRQCFQCDSPQYRDGGFDGPVAHVFDVHAIPQTFTIDSDGVLQDQHIGDASIEGKLKKLIARAQTAGQRQGQ